MIKSKVNIDAMLFKKENIDKEFISIRIVSPEFSSTLRVLALMFDLKANIPGFNAWLYSEDEIIIKMPDEYGVSLGYSMKKLLSVIKSFVDNKDMSVSVVKFVVDEIDNEYYERAVCRTYKVA